MNTQLKYVFKSAKCLQKIVYYPLKINQWGWKQSCFLHLVIVCFARIILRNMILARIQTLKFWDAVFLFLLFVSHHINFCYVFHQSKFSDSKMGQSVCAVCSLLYPGYVPSFEVTFVLSFWNRLVPMSLYLQMLVQDPA